MSIVEDEKIRLPRTWPRYRFARIRGEENKGLLLYMLVEPRKTKGRQTLRRIEWELPCVNMHEIVDRKSGDRMGYLVKGVPENARVLPTMLYAGWRETGVTEFPEKSYKGVDGLQIYTSATDVLMVSIGDATSYMNDIEKVP